MSGNNYYRVYQDFEPVILTKRKSSSAVSMKSKSNIHIDHKIDDSDDIKPIIYYSKEQINIIQQARAAKNLKQVDLAKMISPVLPATFISKIESGETPFDAKTYKKILTVLGIKEKF